MWLSGYIKSKKILAAIMVIVIIISLQGVVLFNVSKNMSYVSKSTYIHDTQYDIAGIEAKVENDGHMQELSRSEDYEINGMQGGGLFDGFINLLIKLASILFAFTCVTIILFVSDRTPRFSQIRYIHRSDGKKSNQ